MNNTFKQDDLNLRHVYNDHVNTYMKYEAFKDTWTEAWKNKYGFLKLVMPINNVVRRLTTEGTELHSIGFYYPDKNMRKKVDSASRSLEQKKKK